jgi:hypothetical protein
MVGLVCWRHHGENHSGVTPVKTRSARGSSAAKKLREIKFSFMELRGFSLVARRNFTPASSHLAKPPLLASLVFP